MSNIRSITASSQVPDDLAERLGQEGVKEILLVLWQGYHELVSNPISGFAVHTDIKEDKITQEWFKKIYFCWESKNRTLAIRIMPFHQFQDDSTQIQSDSYHGKGKSPTIDFCFHDADTNNSYFGIECKILRDNDSNSIKYYVEDGIGRYTSGKYGLQTSESAMAGYVLSGKISDFVRQISALMADSTTSNADFLLENLTREEEYMDTQYLSRHSRVLGDKEIILHHLFLDFSFIF